MFANEEVSSYPERDGQQLEWMAKRSRLTMRNSIMVIDDDEEFVEELNDLLNLSGYETVTVRDPLKAVDIVSREKPDAILLDLKMPGKGGFEVAYEICHLPELARIPVVVMTGYFNSQNNPLVELCQIKKCLKKPFQPLEVIWALEEVLAKK
ncbi:MAG: response regulator [Candidatus Omnitrophica bacterium]|nr:response regulator [Candidatus Omnitrophota bacterium]MDD5671559.1 response regulator [Candidatus Omnitrophota bacterium]